MTATTVLDQRTGQPTRTRGHRRVRAAAVAASAVATSLLFLAGRAAGTDFTITDPGAGKPPHTFLVAEIAVITLIIALLGWATLAVLEHYTTRARQVWTALAAVVLVLSIVPIGIEHATWDTRAMLTLIHIAVAAALVPLVRHRPAAN